MNISTDGIRKLQAYEGLSLKPYRDAGGKWTIGYGHLIKPGEDHLFNGITEQQARDLFTSDLAPFVNRVSKYIKAPLTQTQFDALVIWDFNTGRIHDSTLTKLINSGAGLQAIYDWWVSHYLTASGQYVEGLKKRRELEAVLFTGSSGASSQAGSDDVVQQIVIAGVVIWILKKLF